MQVRSSTRATGANASWQASLARAFVANRQEKEMTADLGNAGRQPSVVRALKRQPKITHDPSNRKERDNASKTGR